MVGIDSVKNVVKVLRGDVHVLEGGLHFRDLKRARVVRVECTERITKSHYVETGSRSRIDEESKSLSLELLGSSPVGHLLHDSELVVNLQFFVANLEPWVLKSLLDSDSLGWVLVEHLGDEVFGLSRYAVPVGRVELKL